MYPDTEPSSLLGPPWSWAYFLVSGGLYVVVDLVLAAIGVSLIRAAGGQRWARWVGGAALWWAATSALGHVVGTVAGFLRHGRMDLLYRYGPWVFLLRDLGVQLWDTLTVAVALWLLARGVHAAIAPPRPDAAP
jgi:hypothetical protein